MTSAYNSYTSPLQVLDDTHGLQPSVHSSTNVPYDTNADLLIKAEYPSASPAASLQHPTPQVLTDNTQLTSKLPDLAAHQGVATSAAPLDAAADLRSSAMLQTAPISQVPQSVQQALQSVPAIEQPAMTIQADTAVYLGAVSMGSTSTRDVGVKSLGNIDNALGTQVAEQVTPAVAVTSAELSDHHLLPKQDHSEGNLQRASEPRPQDVPAGKQCQLSFQHIPVKLVLHLTLI